MLLRREDWAARKLSGHAGKTVNFTLNRLTVGLTLQANGFVQPAGHEVAADVALTIPPGKLARLPRALGSADPDEITALLHIEGDAALARVVSDLARDLRWDIEDDLARLFGDIAAARIRQGAGAVAAGLQSAGRSLAGNVGEYLSEESGQVLGRPAFEQWRQDLRAAAARLDVLERGVAGLERRSAHRA